MLIKGHNPNFVTTKAKSHYQSTSLSVVFLMVLSILILKGSKQLNSICRSKMYVFFYMTEISVTEMSIGRNVLAETSVAEMSMAMPRHFPMNGSGSGSEFINMPCFMSVIGKQIESCSEYLKEIHKIKK